MSDLNEQYAELIKRFTNPQLQEAIRHFQESLNTPQVKELQEQVERMQKAAASSPAVQELVETIKRQTVYNERLMSKLQPLVDEMQRAIDAAKNMHEG